MKKYSRGFVMPLIVIIMLALSVLGFSLLTVWNFDTRHTIFEKNSLKAYYVARAGSESVADYIINNPDALTIKNYVNQLISSSPSSPVALGDGTFTVSVTRDTANHLINITSIGTVGNVTRTSIISLNESTSASSAPLLNKSLFSLGKVNLQGGTIKGDVATNSSASGGVTIGWGGKIEGNVSIGAGGNASDVVTTPNGSTSSFVTGSVTAQDANAFYDLPAFPDQPSGLIAQGDYTAGWSPSPPYYINQDGKYTNLEVESELIIDVGSGQRNIAVDNLSVTGSGKITLNGSGSLCLYVNNTFTLDGSGSINISGDPAKLIMYYDGTASVNLAGSTVFVGTIYANSSDVNLSGSGNLQGNLISGGNNVYISGGSSAVVQTIYAPNATVDLSGSGAVKGVVVANTINMSGKTSIIFTSLASDQFPSDLWQEGGGTTTVVYSMGLRS